MRKKRIRIMTFGELREYIRTMPEEEILHVTFEDDGGEDRNVKETRNGRGRLACRHGRGMTG